MRAIGPSARVRATPSPQPAAPPLTRRDVSTPPSHPLLLFHTRYDGDWNVIATGDAGSTAACVRDGDDRLTVAQLAEDMLRTIAYDWLGRRRRAQVVVHGRGEV